MRTVSASDFRNACIAINSVEGNIEFETHNGGVSVALTGDWWRGGGGLDVETRNGGGGVKLSLPENYAARVESGTVNGGFKSDFAALAPENEEERTRGKRISANLNGGGGALVRVVTTNGGIKINSASGKSL